MRSKQNLSPSEAIKRLQNLCSANEKCSGDIRAKLLQWGIQGTDGEKIIESLKKDKFLDDRRFAGFFVRDKQKINKWGIEKIRFTLKNKGLEPEIINEALLSAPVENFEETLRELLSKKSKELENYNSYDKRNRLIRFAIQRGFDYNLIFRVVDEFVSSKKF